MPKATILIPVYNGAATVGKAIEAAQAQTENDIEILLINDVSTDDTLARIEPYAKADPRIRVISLEKNAGGAGASNVGIDNATGDWIVILDADDWIDPPRVAEMMKAATANGADIVCDNLQIFDHARNQVFEKTNFGRGKLLHVTPELFFNRDNPLRRHAMGYIKPLISRKFLNDHHIRYDAAHRFGYDFIFVAEILLNRAKMVIIPEAYYTYVHRISPTTRKISPHSRSESGHALIFRGCNELLTKYTKVMTPAELVALTRRRDIFKSRLACDDMLRAAFKGRIVEAVHVLIQHPFILVLILTTLGKLALANVMNTFNAINDRRQIRA